MKLHNAIKVIEGYSKYVWDNGIFLPNGSRIPVVFLWGTYGIGKSAMIKDMCKEANAGYLHIEAKKLQEKFRNGDKNLPIGFKDRRLAEDDITNLKGIPDLLKDSKFSTWRLPDDIPFEGNDRLSDKGIWFLDEFNQADKSVKKGAFEAILDHSIGGYPLKKNWYVLCAGNEKSQSIYVEELGKPLETRFVHFIVEPDIDNFSQWGMSTGRIKTDVIAFINWKKEYFCQIDAKSKTKGSPCPRTWEFISTLWDLTLEKFRQDMVMGSVGEGIGTEYMAYLNVWKDLPNIEDILLKGKDIIPTRRDIQYAVYTSLISYIKQAEPKLIKKLAERVIEYSIKLEADFSMFLIKLLYKSIEPEMKNVLLQTAIFRKWAAANPHAFDFEE